MEKLYTVNAGNGYFPMPHLDYQAGWDDRIVAVVHDKLNQYTSPEERRPWRWSRQLLGPEGPSLSPDPREAVIASGVRLAAAWSPASGTAMPYWGG
ncbi:hypothetical protein [Streptomyces sp. I05A-00742]|uniref:hypothetical protein n=1 Tax=Streptomyces sp. I05A-00742 TaxID=2732853 RepID=UPI001489AED5|nr:hypothetical protein [Streptomyces sp. I05A-00742]